MPYPIRAMPWRCLITNNTVQKHIFEDTDIIKSKKYNFIIQKYYFIIQSFTESRDVYILPGLVQGAMNYFK